MDNSMPYVFHDESLKEIFDRRQCQNPQGGQALEKSWNQTKVFDVFNKQNGDLLVLFFVYCIIVVVAYMAIRNIFADAAGPETTKQFLNIAVFGALFGLIGRAYDIAVKRLSVADTLVSEMLSFVRVLAAANIIGDFARLFDRLKAAQAGQGVEPSGFAGEARQSDYFAVYHKLGPDMPLRDPGAVNDIAAFYTFLKGARDATGSMGSWSKADYSLDQKRDDVIAIVYLCFLMLVHGRLALKKLVRSKDNLGLADDIMAGVYLQCFSFLHGNLTDNDFRKQRVNQRIEEACELRERYQYCFGPTKKGPTPCREVGERRRLGRS